MDAWDAEGFEPAKPVKFPGTAAGDRWDGEDEEDAVKDNWEEEDEEDKKDASKEKTGEPTAFQRPKKKPLAERIAEREAKKKNDPAEDYGLTENRRQLTKEEKLEEQLRLRKIQEESDLKLAKEAFGVSDTAGSGIDAMIPVTEAEFDAFKDALKTKITCFQKDKNYASFLEKLITEVMMDLPLEDHRKISTNISTLYHEKERIKKEQDKKKKKKTKAVVKVDREDDLFGGTQDDDDLDFEDFM